MKRKFLYIGEPVEVPQLRAIYFAEKTMEETFVNEDDYRAWVDRQLSEGIAEFVCEYTKRDWDAERNRFYKEKARKQVELDYNLRGMAKKARKRFRKTQEYTDAIARTIGSMRVDPINGDKLHWKNDSETICEMKCSEALQEFYKISIHEIEKHNKRLALWHINELHIRRWLNEHVPAYKKQWRDETERKLLESDELGYAKWISRVGSAGIEFTLLTAETLDEFIAELKHFNKYHTITASDYRNAAHAQNFLINELRAAFPLLASEEYDYIGAMLRFNGNEIDEAARTIARGINKGPKHAMKCLQANPHYTDVLEEVERENKRKEMLTESVVTTMPEKYAGLYPLARQMERHFVLHIGPTNSGKTYAAMEALRKVGSGIYLSPLRLLAFEQYERLNADGYPCSLVTGEEREIVEGATLQASTVEMMDQNREYRLAVVDEAQMIADKDRGWAWTSAILGLRCEEIHVCLAANAEQRIVDLITECGDAYEIVRHERQTPLKADTTTFRFPKDVKKHDALIVFSKRNVHAVAHELRERGISCSIIYGNLPYDVRQAEARKFAEGKTDVLVSTDAIGMGLNLPIRRVVFLELSKFDGERRRMLLPAEAQQIAGRAGRRGKFPKGTYTTEGGVRQIKHLVEGEVPAVEEATIGFPEALLGLDGSISEIVERWEKLPEKDGYVRMNTTVLKQLVYELEPKTRDKLLIYRFATMPFNTEGTEKLVWDAMVRCELAGERLTLEQAERIHPLDSETMKLDELEQAHKICDLLYSYNMNFNHPEDIDEILRIKKGISKRILAHLETSKLEPRRCKYCGRKVPWNHPYGMCQRCYEERYDYYEWW